MTNWNKLESELLKKPGVRKEYERLAPRYTVISQLIAARLKKGMTQKDVARKIGTKQSAIARMEFGSASPTLDFLQKLAAALGAKLSVRITS